MAEKPDSEKCILTLDIGTTFIKCHVLNCRVETVASVSTETQLLYPKPGYVEIDPNVLWHDVLQVIRKAIKNACLTPSNITCISITTQRATFITWIKDTGEPLHNFITWKDTRSRGLVEIWNNSKLFKLTKIGAGIINTIYKHDRLATAKNLKLSTTQCTLRLLWVFENIPAVKIHADNDNLCFGTIDTWLLYKLTARQKFITEVSHASSTGLYDPFAKAWSTWISGLFGIPLHILPEIVNSDYEFGSTAPELLDGTSIPIKALIADQQASVFAIAPLKQNGVKVTMGTGAFIDIVTGNRPAAAGAGSYPLVGWTVKEETTYIIEASCKDAGSLIHWAMRASLIQKLKTLSDDVAALQNTVGVFFVPAFSGLPPPFANENAATGFLGISPTSTNLHLARAILESIAYTIASAYWMLQKDKHRNFAHISVDGGVSKNDFVCQLLADLLRLEVVRYQNSDDTILGATFLAGINAGIWSQIAEIQSIRKIEKIFYPGSDTDPRVNAQMENWSQWKAAIKRFRDWYN